jgi:hypothetical protein
MKSHTASKEPRLVRRRTGIPVLALGFTLLAFGCNSDDSQGLSVDGSWQGSVPEADTQITMLLSQQGKNGIVGSAQVTAPPEGQVTGEVSGTLQGRTVGFTIRIEEAFIGGSIVFSGTFDGDDVMSGTVDSGILGGNFSITFQRQ